MDDTTVAFETEVQESPGNIPLATIEELVSLREAAKLRAEVFSEAIKIQAEKYQISRSALRRYVCAKEADTLLNLDVEASDLASLLERKEVDDGSD